MPTSVKPIEDPAWAQREDAPLPTLREQRNGDAMKHKAPALTVAELETYLRAEFPQVFNGDSGVFGPSGFGVTTVSGFPGSSIRTIY